MDEDQIRQIVREELAEILSAATLTHIVLDQSVTSLALVIARDAARRLDGTASTGPKQ